MIRIALFAVAFLVASSAQAQVRKCVDAEGKIIYTQDPCPANTKPGSISRSVIQTPAAAPADSAAKGDAGKSDAAKSAAPKTAAEQEQAFRKRQQDQAKAAQERGDGNRFSVDSDVRRVHIRKHRAQPAHLNRVLDGASIRKQDPAQRLSVAKRVDDFNGDLGRAHALPNFSSARRTNASTKVSVMS